MKKLYVVTGLLLSVSISGFAQYDNYKLENYVNPTYKRKALDIGFNTAGNFQKTTNDKNNSFSGNLTIGYNQIKNSEKIQQQTTLLTSGNTNSTQTEDNKNRNSKIGFTFEHQGFYFQNNKSFFEVSPSSSLDYSYEKTTEYDPYPDYNNSGKAVNKKNIFSTEISVKLGIGKGRIENVTDARQAVYILEELTKRGVLKHTLSDSEVNAFAEQITLVKNKRRFDSRLALIDEISVVDSFLVANNYIENANNAVYFTSLYDKWMYGDRDIRESGSYIKGGAKPYYSFDEYRSHTHNYSSYLTNTSYSIWGGFIYIDYRNEKPLNLKWQRSFGAGIESGLTRNSEIDKNLFQSNLNLYYGLGYYMNTRTYLEGKVSQTLNWIRFNNNQTENILNSYTALTAIGYYYLSPQLRLFGSVNLSYNFLREMTANHTYHDKYPHTTFSLGVSYALF